MNIIPTLEGGLRVEVESAAEWLLFQSIANDAIQRDESLASELGSLITEAALAEDWRDFVLPELELEFDTALRHVTSAVHDAQQRHQGGPGGLWITPENAYLWFSALNQARLALEDRYQLSQHSQPDPDSLPATAASAMLRSQLYCAIQGLILEHVLR